ncbi:aldo/keto reductase [Paracoccus aminophilus]|uniref:Pyridoxal 4-dehydrogenase n=1 Tax=Paracoccus aminophilus JCM 7686 TaxID=1367847 RepID=S5XUL0_PARAH|nr:aldo/keto reductase [Paracoccus aminophilus]AGT08902.1 pyridoxal 4-dehydrogenase [Paracoccus aminophilus JCM 7686]
MHPSDMRAFGQGGLQVSAVSFGAAPIGNFLREIDEETSAAMIDCAWDAGLRLFDTSPLYGHGLSELRLGHALRHRPRDEFVLATKVGRLLEPAPRGSIDFAPWVKGAPFRLRYDYSYDGALRSIEDSLQRTGLERIDIAFIHDCDRYNHGTAMPEVFRAAMDGAGRALERLRDEGVVTSIGVGVNEWDVCHMALQERDFDAFLLAGRYTLLEQDALESFLPLCEARGASVLVGGGFNSGILATGAVPGAKYNYQPAPPDVMAKVAEIEKLCAAHGVALPAAALQFVLAHPAIASFCAGTRTVEQLRQNLAWVAAPIPADFWAELKARGLLRNDAPVPAA